jgi:hypothetical protein
MVAGVCCWLECRYSLWCCTDCNRSADRRVWCCTDCNRSADRRVWCCTDCNRSADRRVWCCTDCCFLWLLLMYGLCTVHVGLHGASSGVVAQCLRDVCGRKQALCAQPVLMWSAETYMCCSQCTTARSSVRFVFGHVDLFEDNAACDLLHRNAATT